MGCITSKVLESPTDDTIHEKYKNIKISFGPTGCLVEEFRNINVYQTIKDDGNIQYWIWWKHLSKEEIHKYWICWKYLSKEPENFV
jgi:hypothetical protein